MDELGALILGKAPESTASPQKSPTVSKTQAERDQEALTILQGELTNVQNQLSKANDPQQKRRLQGDAESLLKEISRKSKTPLAPQQTQQQQAPQDELGAMILGKQAQPTQPSKPSQQTQPAQPVQQTQPSTLGGEVKPLAGPKLEGTSLGRMAGNFLGQVQEAKRGFGERVAGGIDTLYGVVPAIYGAGVQALARTANTPQEAERIGQQAAATIDKPLGKAFGITGKQTYQQPLGGVTEPIAKEANRMFNQLGMTPEQISEKLGIPAEDIRNMVVIGSVALPQAVKETIPAVKQVGQTVAAPFREAASELQVQRPSTAAADLQAQFAAKQAPPPGSVGAAGVQNNPFAGKFTGEEYGGSETFPQLKLAKIPKDVPVPEQQLRSQLFQEVLPGVKPRMGVVTGNDNLLRNEHALAGMAEPSPLGLRMKEQIANEQIGLSKFAEDRVNATGASKSLINDEQRGQRINDVMYGAAPDDISPSSITGYFNQSKKQIYDSAFDKVGNNKINTTHADELFADPQTRSTFKAAGTLNLLESAQELIDLARTAGFKLPDGTVAPPGSVAAYDAVRKHFNSPTIWNRDRAGSIREINGAIDRDIAAVADPALYKLGDKIHKLEKSIFESPGIKKLFGEVDQNGVLTSATPLEKIPSKLNNLPKDQWRHVRDTLNDLANGRVRNAPEGLPPVPDELRQYAKSAVAEIDGALAREVYTAGAKNVGEWSSKKANDVMNSVVGQKIVETFPPDEVRRFHALNYVGQYTPALKYEGAALQGRRVGLIEKGLPGFGGTVGATVGGYIGESPIAAAGGAYIGKEIGTKLQAGKIAREEAKAVKKMEKQQKKAAELGTKLSDLGK
jgi:hypothetical protein